MNVSFCLFFFIFVFDDFVTEFFFKIFKFFEIHRFEVIIYLFQKIGEIRYFCLEIICNSAGYECYQLNGPGNLIIVGRGGNTIKDKNSSIYQ